MACAIFFFFVFDEFVLYERLDYENESQANSHKERKSHVATDARTECGID